MKISFAHVCDLASVTREGKLNVLGIFQKIHAAKFPARHASLFLVFETELQPLELAAPIRVKMDLQDADGASIISGNTEFRVATKPKPGDVVRVPQMMQFAGLVFPHAGRYKWTILLNDRVEHELAFDVLQLEKALPA